MSFFFDVDATVEENFGGQLDTQHALVPGLPVQPVQQ